MSQWYLSKNGQALGPLEEDKVVALIREGELSPVDLVYQMGATEWMPIAEVEKFAQHFRKEEEEIPSPPSVGDKEWVILKKVTNEKGKEYKQLGPFSVSQVFQMIDQGEAKFSDFAWKQGMETWVKISELAEFDNPLPSSPPVDTSIYEKTNVDFEVPADTVVDREQKASLTELVNIEHFQHEKTMVQPIREPLKAVSQPASSQQKHRPPEKVGRSRRETFEDDERTSDLEDGEKALFTEISEVTPIPINEESFVTDSDIAPVESSESDISLWSLEPPSNKKNSEASNNDATQVAIKKKDAKPSKDKKKKDKPKPKPKPKKEGEGFALPAFELTTEAWQWIGVISAVIFAVVFFYQSFRGANTEIQYDETRQFDPESGMIIEEPGKPFDEVEIEKKMADYKDELQKAREEKPIPVPIAGSKVSSDIVKKIAPPPPGPKVPIAEKAEPVVKEEIVPPPEEVKTPEIKKVVEAKPKPKTPVVEEKERSLAGKKKVIETRAKVMQKTKKKPEPVKPAKTPTSSQAKPAVVAVAAGGAKAQSFFKQRDRMALFYSSLKAETLAVDIANQYTKLKGSQTAWARYYGQWKKKVQASLAQDIRDFPKSKETYAYPKVLAEFKKDYALFYKYGESFDAKVKGLRAPSEVPGNMREVFTKYKQTAQSLGK